ncbi:MAG: calcium/sodium antiporter [Gammaproteobacteria bacterium]|nr:calcium/sodium antiporter [Gammaproteobacteria bacterium]
MSLAYSAIVIGFFLLAWGADRFVLGASAIARNLGISPLIIGLTVVAFGTSFPEMLISAVAAWEGNPSLAIGNAIGSNITNIGLVLGATALIVPLTIHSDTLQREFPILFVVMVFTLLLMLDNELGRLDGFLLIIGMFVLLYWIVRLAIRTRKTDPMKAEFTVEIPYHMPTRKAVTHFFVGLIVLFISSKILVWGAIVVAKSFGISDLVIGLTIVAIGTSLPELAASIMSAIKKEHDIAVGNIIGSNMFNLLAVMGIAGVIHPASFVSEVLTRDFLLMFILTAGLFAMAYGMRGSNHINRWKGSILLLTWFGYLVYLYQTSI